METESLEVPNNLTVAEAQQVINTASALKAGADSVVHGASKVADGVTGMLHGTKKVFTSVVRTITCK